MQAKPAKTTSTFPGSRSRYDDYQALHISQTDYIHFDVSKSQNPLLTHTIG